MYPSFLGGYPMKMKLSGRDETAVFRSVKRACYAGLDSVTLRTEVARRIAPAVPYGAYSFSTMDPDTGLLTHAVGEGIPEQVVRAFVEVLYPQEQAMQVLDRVRSGEIVSTSTSDSFAELIRVEGVGHEMNTILCTGGALWGDLCLLRESRSTAYAEREARFMRRIAPHIARGLKTAATLAAAGETPGTGVANPAEIIRSAPGVVVLDGKVRTILRNPNASAYLADLTDVGVPTGETPYALLSAVALLRALGRGAGTGFEDAPEDAMLRARGRSGSWYTLRASLSEPGPASESSTIVTIEPVVAGEVAPILTRLYGLSPREREVLVLAARGESTKGIASQLGLSIYTVQEHIGNACEKVGVQGRKALLAKLFFDGYASKMRG
jgi:DNA-binding CsgD family transcriptional regulator